MKYSLKLILIFLFVVFAKQGFSSHIVGYDMSVTRLAVGSGYLVKITLFRDASPGTAGMPANVTFNVLQNGTNLQVASLNARRISLANVTYDPKDCPPPGADLKLEVGVFVDTIKENTLGIYSHPAGYYLVGSICCRNTGIDNLIPDSQQYGNTFTMDFPSISPTSSTANNSSPRYTIAPLSFFCVGKPYTLDWGVVDPDGDSLVYSLLHPMDDGSATKPFPLVPFAPGYNMSYNIIDGVPDLTVNPYTGKINFIPTRIGKYVVGFMVEEYRNNVKIGHIIREFQLETVLCPEAPPETTNENNLKKMIVDTIYYGTTYTTTFTSRDSPDDSLYMFIDVNLNDNILHPRLDAKWGRVGVPTGGQTAQDLVIEGVGFVQGVFTWKPSCDAVRPQPYKFNIVVEDATCPTPFSDTTYVTLYVIKDVNRSPQLVINNDTLNDRVVLKRYFVETETTFQLMLDSVIKVYDKDRDQIIDIRMEADLGNGNDVNSRFAFNATPGTGFASADFRWSPTCKDADGRTTPYLVNFIGYDNDCKAYDSVILKVEIYVIQKPNRKPLFANSNIESLVIPEGTLGTFDIKVLDTFSVSVNRYKSDTLFVDLSDFDDMARIGGSMPSIPTRIINTDSIVVNFSWLPVCANVRLEPYRVILWAKDDGCPSLNSYDTILVYASGPFNSAPEFLDPAGSVISVIDTTIYGGQTFTYNLFAIDTNQRFDSVFLSFDYTSDIINGTIVKNPANLIFAEGKDSARTTLEWKTDCFDIRSTPYRAIIIAKDNECVNPKVASLVFNITVMERANSIPTLRTDVLHSGDTTIMATETLVIRLTATDTSSIDLLTIDSVFTNVPNGLPVPEIVRVTGYDSITTELRWLLDCSLIRDEPYLIKLAGWDDVCRSPLDSARFQFTIKVIPNPALDPMFELTSDTIEIVAGQEYVLDVNSESILTGDSILISSYGSVYGAVPGNFATFEQTEVSGLAKGVFKWTTSCDQITDTVYNVYFTTSNPPCKTAANDFKLSFRVIPNTDVTDELPNVFTPNGDDKNDTYKISGKYKVYCDPGFKFTIYNRWGKKVFESVDPDFEWTGDGLGTGTYFYTLESRARTQTGSIELLR